MKKTKLLAKKGFRKLTLEEVKAKQLKRNPKLIGYGLGTWGKTPSVKPKTGRNRPLKKKVSISKLKKKADSAFSQFIRIRDKGKCYTCGLQKHWKEMQIWYTHIYAILYHL